MSGLFVLGAERSGVSLLARALAQEEGMALCENAARVAVGKRVIACLPDKTPDCPHLASMPAYLEAHPEARAVVVWRQAVDFVNSRLRARPDQPFVDHCLLWARAQKEAQRLKAQFGARVDLVEFRALVDGSFEEGRGPILVPGFRLTGEALTKFLKATPRFSLTARRPVVDAARTAWSMGEVEALARICGPAMRGLGERVDLAAAARRRVLDLGLMFYERAYQVGRIEMAPSDLAGAPWTISMSGGASAPAQLRLTAVPAAERRRLRLTTRARSLPAAGLRWEALEAPTRRPLFVAPCRAGDEIDARLPAHDGWIEIALVCPRLETGQGFQMDLVEARLSHE
jgi:hypothetical protein